jgi:hypothetical protein
MIERKKNQQWIAVCGTRTFNEPQLLYEKMDFYVSKLSVPPIVLTGGQKQRVFKTLNSYLYVGADYFAEMWAYARKLTVRIHRPDFDTHGSPAALHIRNREMVEEATVLVAFWNGKSPGTKSVIEMARKKKIPVKIVRY